MLLILKLARYICRKAGDMVLIKDWLPENVMVRVMGRHLHRNPPKGKRKRQEELPMKPSIVKSGVANV